MKRKQFVRLAAALASTLALALPVNVQAQVVQLHPETTSYRYDGSGRMVGEIMPDPDGSDSLEHLAVRTVYDTAGLILRIESGELDSWQDSSVAPNAWVGFTIFKTEHRAYDTLGQLVRTWVSDENNVTVSVVEVNYDREGRGGCTAVRMNPSLWSATTSACSHTTAGPNGSDRIAKNIYGVDGRLLQVRKAVGTPIEIADVTYSYTDNGQIKQVVDANGNRAGLSYDGHDRQTQWVFPSKTRPSSSVFNDATPASVLSTAGALNEDDYEEYTYDKNGNRLSLRKRDESVITYTYDNLNRMTVKTVPDRIGLPTTHTRNVYYTYDLRGLQTSARFNSATGNGPITTYDGFGRVASVLDTIDNKNRMVSYEYDANGNRTKITHPDGEYFQYEYDGLNRLDMIRQNASWMGTVAYNQRGLPEQRSWRANYATSTVNSSAWGYDPVGRLDALTLDMNGTSADVLWGFTRNPASQILTETQSNDTYSWDGHVNVDRNYTTNGLNQYEAAGSASFCYDANGNLTADGDSVYLYDVENRLVEKRVQTNTDCTDLSYAGALTAELRYDPLGRLYRIRDHGAGTGTRRFLYDGDAIIAEYNNLTTMLRRYVHGSDAGADDPLIWYEGSVVNAASRRYMHADPRGSIVAITDYQGNPIATNTYDEYGINGTGNIGRFQYTGQLWLPELDMYYYKARIYSPTLGRFMQTDPIGYDDGMNMYAYVGNDPINGVDPSGLQTVPGTFDLEAACGSNVGCMQGYNETMQDVASVVIPLAALLFDFVNTPISPGPDATLVAAGAAAAKKGASSAARPKPRINPQKQAGHISGTPQHANRIKQGKRTSTFKSKEQGESVTRDTHATGKQMPGRPRVREKEFGEPVGTGPEGGTQSRVRTHEDAKGNIHGHPCGPQAPCP